MAPKNTALRGLDPAKRRLLHSGSLFIARPGLEFAAMRLLSRLFWAFIFFTLFAFALNNQQLATVRFFFGLEWQGQMVFVVLVAFGLGCALGVLAMAPHWWRERREVKRLGPANTPAPLNAGSALQRKTTTPSSFGVDHPSREGL